MTMRNLLSAFAFVLVPLCGWAGPVDVETARQQAMNFFSQHSSSQSKRRAMAASEMKLLHVQQQKPNEQPLLYVFGQEGGEGYAIIAGDDAAVNPVLGYSTTGTFREDSIPCCLRYLLDEYSRQLEFARQSPQSVRRAANRASSRTNIAPLIKSKWSQHAPYNNLCPIDQNTGKRCVTGCVATAMAQIMYYHKWPLQGTGSHSYECQGKTLTADFGATQYQWSKMKDTYGYNAGDPGDAVATLMYHCGVAVDMHYTSDASAASVSPETLINYFNYSQTAKLLWAKNVSSEVFETTIYEELAAARPVLISGSGSEGGHQFICDGYKNGYFHFNFGWGGSSDDYYLLTAINTDNGTFNSNQDIIYGIQKSGNGWTMKERTINGVRYKLFPDGTAILVKGTASGNYTVPSLIQSDGEQYTIVAIEKKAFVNNSQLTSLTIPASIVSVDDSAFFGCTELKKVVLKESETPIAFGYRVFSIQGEQEWSIYPTSLLEVSIGRDFSGTPFEYASNLSSVTLGKQVTQLPSDCFWGCSSLQTLTLPAACRTVGDGAFGGTDIKVSVDNNNPYLYMEDDVLFQKDGNVLVYYPSFKEDRGYTIPDHVEKIAAYAFPSNRQLIQLTIPAGVKTIGNYAFGGLYNITTILSHAVVPPTCSSPSYTFYGYMKQTPFLYVPKESMSTYRKTEPWKQFTIRDIASAKPSGTETINGITYELTVFGTATILKGNPSGTFTIPNSVNAYGNNYAVTAIEEEAFAECADLATLIIPATITSVGEKAFFNCKKLTKVVLEESETPINFGYTVFGIQGESEWSTYPTSLLEVSIGRDFSGTPFEDASNLSSVTLGNRVTALPAYSFGWCYKLQTLVLPAACRTVGDGAFASTYIKITVDKNNPYLYTQNDVLFQKEGNVLVYYPNFKEDKEYTIPDHVEKIAPYAFPGNRKLTQLTIPTGLKTLGVYAFGGLYNITTIVSHAVVPPTCSSPSYTFYGNIEQTPFLYVPKEVMTAYQGTKPWSQFIIRDLATLKPSGTETINGITYELAATGSATILEGEPSGTLTIPQTVRAYDNDYEVTAIGDDAFYACNGLSSVTISNGVTSIGSYAFGYCRGLTTIKIPDNVTSISYCAFYGCRNLSSVTIGKGVNSIGSYALGYCGNLTDVYCLAEEVISQGTNIFDSSNIANATLHVPASALNDYKNATPWSGFGSIVPLTKEEESTAIQQLTTGEQQAENGIEQIITVGGKTVRTLQKGINIVRYKDGTTRKILLTR